MQQYMKEMDDWHILRDIFSDFRSDNIEIPPALHGATATIKHEVTALESDQLDIVPSMWDRVGPERGKDFEFCDQGIDTSARSGSSTKNFGRIDCQASDCQVDAAGAVTHTHAVSQSSETLDIQSNICMGQRLEHSMNEQIRPNPKGKGKSCGGQRGAKKKTSAERQRRYRERKTKEFKDLRMKIMALRAQWMHATEVNHALKRREKELSILLQSKGLAGMHVNQSAEGLFDVSYDVRLQGLQPTQEFNGPGGQDAPSQQSGVQPTENAHSCDLPFFMGNHQEETSIFPNIEYLTGSVFQETVGKLLLHCNKMAEGSEETVERLRLLFDARSKEIASVAIKNPKPLLEHLSEPGVTECHFGRQIFVDYLQLTSDQCTLLGKVGKAFSTSWNSPIKSIEHFGIRQERVELPSQASLDCQGLFGTMAAMQKEKVGLHRLEEMSLFQTRLIIKLFLDVGSILMPLQNARFAILPGSPVSNTCQLCSVL